MKLSIVTPCFNESDLLPIAIPKLVHSIRELGIPFELVVVNDGSTDASREILEQSSKKWPEVRVLTLVRNFGHQNAMLAGIDHSDGEWVVTMDIDLQDPPSVVFQMLERAWSKRVCLVLTQRSSRDSDTWFKRNSANLFYRILSVFNTHALKDSGDFRLMHRCVVSQVRSRQGDSAPLRLYLPWLGIPFETVKFRREPRVAGTTKYSFGKMLKLSLESYLAFGSAPLRFVAYTGVFLGVFSAFVGLAEVIIWLQGKAIPGFTTIVLPLLFANAVIMLSIGLLGEYLAVALNTIRSRPKYLLDDCPHRWLDSRKS
jgi:glycosyltransferase involved in cell wall biosynthesis